MLPHSAAIEGDHRELIHRLGCLVSRFRRMGYGPAFRTGVAQTAGEVEALLAELRDHMEFEDEVLMPALAQAAPGAEEMVGRLGAEHGALRGLGEKLHAEVAAGSAAARKTAARFLGKLLEHLDHEERVFEQISKRIPPERFEALASRLRRWNLERWIEQSRDWLEVAGVRLQLRDVRDGTAYLLVRAPAGDHRDLEDRLRRKILDVEPTIEEVQVDYEDPRG